MSDEDESATDMTYEYKIHCSQSFFFTLQQFCNNISLIGENVCK